MMCTYQTASSRHSRPSDGACWPPPSAPGTSWLSLGSPWFFAVWWGNFYVAGLRNCHAYASRTTFRPTMTCSCCRAAVVTNLPARQSASKRDQRWQIESISASDCKNLSAIAKICQTGENLSDFSSILPPDEISKPFSLPDEIRTRIARRQTTPPERRDEPSSRRVT